MRSNASIGFKDIIVSIFGIILGIWMLYSQVQRDLQHRELKSSGQIVAGTLQEATRRSVNYLIPMGYSLQISYAGQSKKFDVSRSLFYRHVNTDGMFKVNELIPVVFLPNRPNVAELPEMLGLSVWWFGGPLLTYPFGVLFIIGAFLRIVKPHSPSHRQKPASTRRQ